MKSWTLVALLLAAAATSTAQADCVVGDEDNLGNGFCNGGDYNTHDCDWDGGDCCGWTCESSEEFTCGFNGVNGSFTGYPTCLDPSVCASPDIAFVGDALCNPTNNNANCSWDGGDCCVADCVDTTNNTCGFVNLANGTVFVGFTSCANPNTCNLTTSSEVALLGDGFCNVGEYNTENCGWDGGDCCEQTCTDGPSFTCGMAGNASVGFLNCEDPGVCSVGNASALGNGFCDTTSTYNTEKCGWDGGDCCLQSCTSTGEYNCGFLADGTGIGFNNCEDPAYDFTLPEGCVVPDGTNLGNGLCNADSTYNNANCSWDGGDCCEDTCEDGTYECGMVGNTSVGYLNCQDPDICAVGDETQLRNGYCNLVGGYNTERCGWDGGDCCASTCADGPSNTCGNNENNTVYVGFACLNPDVCNVGNLSDIGNGICDGGDHNTLKCSWDGGDCCVNTCEGAGCGPLYPECATPGQCAAADPAALGDGYCDNEVYNNVLCDWDGGDCCEDSCVSTSTHTCGHSADNAIEVGYLECADPLNQPPDYCGVPDAAGLGDGFCNLDNYNKANCSWDGGDCCEFTCVDGANHTCGYNQDDTEFVGFPRCYDPDVLALGECLVDNPSFVGDGLCNTGTYNTMACGWDGGDCCYYTCNSTATQTCGYDFNNSRFVGYDNCEDPDTCTGIDFTRLGDALCDTDANNHACGWDSGDCCARTCVDNVEANLTCPPRFDNCEDPFAQPIPPELENCTAAILVGVGDGFCDHGPDIEHQLNTEACTWDGGDCCVQTCRHDNTSTANCGEDNDFFCRNPVVLERYPNCTEPDLSYLGDGFCDHQGRYNTHNCSWDGGDCCQTSCVPTAAYDCTSDFLCIDPTAPDFGACPIYDSDEGLGRSGDGQCDNTGERLSQQLNNERCGWDGGDCCPSTCAVGDLCESFWYACKDPNATDYGTTGECNAPFTSYLGDGACDDEGVYNTARCNWDGGDCCKSTCRDSGTYTCDSRPYYCLDPSTPEANVSTYGCLAEPYSHVGDGLCDYDSPWFNTQRCNWDGGDCCPETCEDGEYYDCTAIIEALQEEEEGITPHSFCEDPEYRPNTTSSSTSTVTSTTGGVTTSTSTSGGGGVVTTSTSTSGGGGGGTTTQNDIIAGSTTLPSLMAAFLACAAFLVKL